MKRTTFGKAAISSLLVATTMVGCTGAAFRPSAGITPQKLNPVKFAAAAEKALAARDGAAAVEAAEGAVRAAPDNGAYRQLLGRAYVLSGRFASAETAFTDALTLGNRDSRTIITLALVQVGLGKPDAARALLAEHGTQLPAGDFGLALAMAGDPNEGVRILSDAIHAPSANARTRQNLAYAYALAGRWKDARLVAGMDLDTLAANQRISQWAQMADPALAPQRVAALMGIRIDGADAGQPVALALAAPAAAPVAVAEAAPVPTTEPTAPVEVASADPAPAPAPMVQPVEPSLAPAAPAVSAPVRVAARDFVIEDRTTRQAPKAGRAATPAPVARMQQVAFLKPVSTGASNWVVQLGAYESAAVAREKWTVMTRGNATLAAFPVLTSQATVNGKAYHRLAISGFGSRADAAGLCRTIQARRGQCFVREMAPGATQPRWASAAKGRQFASR